jgi:hypothetical protein
VDPEQLLDHGAEADLGQARQTGAELGVEDEVGVQPDLAQAREILARGVNEPMAGGSKRNTPLPRRNTWMR